MKEHFTCKYDLSLKTTLEEFREDLQKYIANYNLTPHSSINTSPISRFFDSGNEIIRLEDDFIDETFLLEVERKVSPDCVVQLDTKSFEVPQRYSNKKVTIRYSNDYQTCYVINPDESLTKIELLDKVANSKIKRQQPKFEMED